MRVTTIQIGTPPSEAAPRPAPKNLRVKNGRLCCARCDEVPERCRCHAQQLGDLVLVMT